MKPTPPAPLLSVVIPTFNEAANLPAVIEDAVRTFADSPLAGAYELLVVDDGSTDGSGAVAEELARRHPCVRVLRHGANLGLGAALQTGYRASTGDFATFIPADGQVGADQVVLLCDQIGDADIITSDRLGYKQGDRHVRRAFHRELLTWCFQTLTRLLLGFRPSRLTGIYVVRGAIVRELPFCSRTGLIGLEVYAHCLRIKARMAHGAICIRPRLSGHSKTATLSGVVSQFAELFKIRRHVRGLNRRLPASGIRGAA